MTFICETANAQGEDLRAMLLNINRLRKTRGKRFSIQIFRVPYQMVIWILEPLFKNEFLDVTANRFTWFFF